MEMANGLMAVMAVETSQTFAAMMALGFLPFRILSPIACRNPAGHMFQVSGSLSTKTGVAPQYAIGLADAENVIDWQITSSPYPTPHCTNAR